MTRHHFPQSQPFGTLLGSAEGGVEVYSSDYETIDPARMPDRAAFKNTLDGIYMGYKWQCVELARRWLYVNRGYVFDDIAMAYDIYRLRHVRVIADGAMLPLRSFRNGARRRPEPGCLLIWDEGGEFRVTGHVAVVVEVTDTFVRVVEQNVDHALWASGAHFSRQLPARLTGGGGFVVDCTFPDTSILGWVIQTNDDAYAEVMTEPDAALFALKLVKTGAGPTEFLDTSRPAEQAYVEANRSHGLAATPENQDACLVMSETARAEVRRATNELHAMFMRATDWVLERPDVLARFNLPAALLPRIRQSWQNRRTHTITGRFDFALRSNGLKVYEYNADSASCHMECGLVQGAWADAHGVSQGRGAGARLHAALVDAWRESEIDSVLHILQDDDGEETYHALYMQSALDAAGIRSKIVRGLRGLGWDREGWVVDQDGERITWVWKTWAWETALDQLRDEAVDEDAFLASHAFDEPRSHAPRLIDILLRPEVMVFEPLWSVIPSNKAILPVLWELFPGHPYLLESHFELTPSPEEIGYVRKPIVGRCGGNILLVSRDNQVLEETEGQFAARDDIYQALFRLPEVDGLRVQVFSFTADGTDAGVCVRCDRSLVIQNDSEVLALRILDDESFLDVR